MALTEIRLSGFGGQGVILAGVILGRAAALYEKKNATLTESYGPEARGGACSADLIISDNPILYPKVEKPSILVALSQEAYEKYEPDLGEGGVLITEADLVKPRPVKKGIRHFTVPATRIAEDLGRSIVANIVMLGFYSAVAESVSYAALKEAVKASVPPGTEDLNLGAFQRGYEHGLAQLGSDQLSANPCEAGQEGEPAVTPVARKRSRGRSHG